MCLTKNGRTKASVVQIFLSGVCFLLSKSTIYAWTSPIQTQRSRQLYASSTSRRKLPFGNTQQSKRKSGLRVLSPLTLNVEASQSSSSSSSIKGKNKGQKGQIRVRKKKKKTQRNTVKVHFQNAKRLERQGKWVEACQKYEQILQRAPKDAYSHLALARLEARRERKHEDIVSIGKDSSHSKNPISTLAPSRAEAAFGRGTKQCPESVHLWQAWAVYEETQGNISRARELFEQALILNPQNAYVCQAYGLMEKKLGNRDKAVKLFEQALEENSTAALVCSLGEILMEDGKAEMARGLYERHLPRLKSEKDKIEVYLASAWLEERNFSDFDRAKELLHLALNIDPESGLGNVALARLEGRIQRRRNKSGKLGKRATAERLVNACRDIEKNKDRLDGSADGRVFNALASLEVQNRNFTKAREVLKRGMEIFPRDHTVSNVCIQTILPIRE